jgi:hypothetical protein
MRTLWKDLDKSKQDFSKEDLTNAYFCKVDFTNSKFGKITNATFVQCDLTDSDWSIAEFQGVTVTDCIGTNTIKLLPTINAFVHRITAPIKAGLIPALSHDFMAIACEQYALILKEKKYQDIFKEMAVDLRAHPEMCWVEFIKLWGLIKWPNDEKYAKYGVEMVKSDPNIYKQWVRFAVPVLKNTYSEAILK